MELSTLAQTLSSLLVAVNLPGTLLLLVLSVAALFYRPAPRGNLRPASRTAIVVPAHNEADKIGELVDQLMMQIGDDFNTDLWVLADNCSDNTADLARARGAKVLERTNLEKRGKGPALQYAFSELESGFYEWLMVVDADSILDESFLHHMQLAMRSDANVLQACYEGTAETNSSDTSKLARIAMTGMNVVRVKGRAALGASAGILGNGFAVRREVLAKVPYLADSVVEDLEYHLRLIDADLRVDFVPDARIWGDIAASKQSLATQRSRWEGGRLRMIRQFLPKALLTLVKQRSVSALESALDLLLLPITFQLLIAVIGAIVAAVSGSWLALAAFALMPVALAAHLTVTLAQPGITAEERALMIKLPGYLLFKLAAVPRILAGSSSKALWVRTERSSGTAAGKTTQSGATH